jgi:hypothetical protein
MTEKHNTKNVFVISVALVLLVGFSTVVGLLTTLEHERTQQYEALGSSRFEVLAEFFVSNAYNGKSSIRRDKVTGKCYMFIQERGLAVVPVDCPSK